MSYKPTKKIKYTQFKSCLKCGKEYSPTEYSIQSCFKCGYNSEFNEEATKVDFDNWIIGVHQQLFHIDGNDIDSGYGIKIESIIILKALNEHLWVMKFATITEILNKFNIK